MFVRLGESVTVHVTDPCVCFNPTTRCLPRKSPSAAVHDVQFEVTPRYVCINNLGKVSVYTLCAYMQQGRVGPWAISSGLYSQGAVLSCACVVAFLHDSGIQQWNFRVQCSFVGGYFKSTYLELMDMHVQCS